MVIRSSRLVQRHLSTRTCSEATRPEQAGGKCRSRIANPAIDFTIGLLLVTPRRRSPFAYEVTIIRSMGFRPFHPPNLLIFAMRRCEVLAGMDGVHRFI